MCVWPSFLTQTAAQRHLYIIQNSTKFNLNLILNYCSYNIPLFKDQGHKTAFVGTAILTNLRKGGSSDPRCDGEGRREGVATPLCDDGGRRESLAI